LAQAQPLALAAVGVKVSALLAMRCAPEYRGIP
jgi:hypothetical protein